MSRTEVYINISHSFKIKYLIAKFGFYFDLNRHFYIIMEKTDGYRDRQISCQVSSIYQILSLSFN